MAAGRQWVVGYSEFRDRETEYKEYKVSKGEIGYKKGVGRDRIRGRDRGYERGDIREDVKCRNRHDEIEREVMRCCEDRLVSSRSDWESSDDVVWRRRGLERAVDREPGEMSSDSGSDQGIDSDSQVKENEIKELANRKLYPKQGKKRQLLPILRDRYDKKIGNSHVVSSSTLPKSLETSKVGLDDGNCISRRPSKIAKIQVPEPAQCSMEFDPYSSSCSSSLIDQTLSEEAHRVNNYIEVGFVEDDGFIPLRSIRSSRWANDFDSPADQGEMYEEMPDAKKKLSDTVGIRGHEKSATLELGELKPEGSSRVRLKSESDELVWLSSKDSCSGRVTDNYDMEVDEDHQYDGGSASQSDTELEDAHGTPNLDLSPHRNVNMLHGCRSVDEFERLNKINEGTFGIVYRARDKKTGEIVALKKVKMEKEREGFPSTALREINILLSFNHSSIVDVKEVVVGTSLDDIFMVMEYMEHDLKKFLEAREQPFSESEVKCLMLQLLKGTEYLHDNWVLHRDLKTSNLLLNNRFELKICDLGLARQYGSPLKPYTQLVVTLWYRAPELLLGAKQYSTAIDMWSLGCIMSELLSKEPLFNGKSEIDQIDKIYRTLGTPDETIWPGYSKLPGAVGNFVKHQENMLRKKFPRSSFTGAPVLSEAGFDLLSELLTYDPERRISAEAALQHKWFQEVRRSNDIEFLPITSLHRHAQDRRM